MEIMIERKRLLALDYYKKEHFSGSDAGLNMRYRIERFVEPLPEDASEDTPSPEPVFRATVWPEPYSYEATDPVLFITHNEPFSEEGLNALVAWMNMQNFSEDAASGPIL